MAEIGDINELKARVREQRDTGDPAGVVLRDAIRGIGLELGRSPRHAQRHAVRARGLRGRTTCISYPRGLIWNSEQSSAEVHKRLPRFFLTILAEGKIPDLFSGSHIGLSRIKNEGVANAGD